MSKEKYPGLSSKEAAARLATHGPNELAPAKKENFLLRILHTLTEPMFLLLIIAATTYFFLGEPGDGAVMLVSVAVIIAIDAAQEWKTDRALAALKELSAPKITVIRDGRRREISSAELVPGDYMLIQEGIKVPADGYIVECADLRIDESSLTGEPEAVWKRPYIPKTHAPETHAPENRNVAALETTAEQTSDTPWRLDYCYAGTLVTTGSAVVEVAATGVSTEYGKISQHIAAIPPVKTPLQRQTSTLVKTCALIALGLFLLVILITWFNLSALPFGDRLIQSILAGVTLAMALIPEEFPVILTVFLSMGAWRLVKKNSLVHKLPAVETLGAVTVLCVDKTGTITENRMSVRETWLAPDVDEPALLEAMGLACESDPYDPMEKAMLRYCSAHHLSRESLFSRTFVSEYSFTDETKMMGHIWEKSKKLSINIKGSPEAVLSLCRLSQSARAAAERELETLSAHGLRVIAVAAAHPASRADIPEKIQDVRPELLGFVGLADPPRENVAADIAVCQSAGVRVVMITGDNGITARAIAEQIGIRGAGNPANLLTGADLENMSDTELRKAVRHTVIFSRVIPEHKLRIVKALQANGEAVAMTGDGVNDAPALRAADIGIAMGGRGSEVAREAADLILLDDNFHTIVETIRDGRRIYDNIKKAIGYIFIIHIPVAFSSLLAPLLGIEPAFLFFLPIHVVLFEIVIDPTCSIVLERQPAETDIMERPPRRPDARILTKSLLFRSLLQGFIVFLAAFGLYYFILNGYLPLFVSAGADLVATARTLGLATIILSNLFLVFELSSDSEPTFRVLRRLARDRVMQIATLATLAFLGIIIYSPLSIFLSLAPLNLPAAGTVIILSALAVFWRDLTKHKK